MHAHAIVARVLAPCLESLHAKRARAMTDMVEALLQGGRASLSAIAQHLPRPCTFKHRLKAVDRLLGNAGLHQHRAELYQALAQHWLHGMRHWLVVVDWSDLTLDQHWHLLRASVVVEGRSVTLYEEVHPQKRLGHPAVHRRFVQRLRHMIPAGYQVIVMTDAGFHSPWFQLIEAQGWGWIGRIRGKNRVRLDAHGAWEPARMLYDRASHKAARLGLGAYARSNPVDAVFVLAKRPNKGRHSRNIYGRKRVGRASAKSARAAGEPWLLASSCRLQHLSAQTVVNLYAQRMRIEQTFRDTKNLRVGFGLSSARSRSGMRLEMLLLLTHLASFVQRLIGESLRQQQRELDFTATRRHDRPEISVLTLARRWLDSTFKTRWRGDLASAITELRRQAENAATLPG